MVAGFSDWRSHIHATPFGFSDRRSWLSSAVSASASWYRYLE
uniref:Uncharacterized protein n=1 Tax=Arundo donax TaxID=35708 RepID=A0A0A9I3A5_ARUDO